MNYLQPKKESSPHFQTQPVRGEKKRHKWIIFFILFCFILLSSLAFFGYQANRLYAQSLLGKQEFESALDLLKTQELSQAQGRLVNARTHFSNALSASSYLSPVTWVPLFEHEYKFAKNLLILGQTSSDILANGLDTVVKTIPSLDHFSYNDLSQEQKIYLLTYFSSISNDVIRLQAAIQQVRAEGHYLSNKKMNASIQSIHQLVMPQLEQASFYIEELLPFLHVSSKLAGYPKQQTFILLLQNHHELRPTGGFIGTYGILQIQNATITEYFTDNIYNIDNQATEHVPPPWQLTKYMSVRDWLMRDANWAPDFPTSAQNVMWFYEKQGGEFKDIDGVIAITPVVIEKLLEFLGPMTIDGQLFTAENFMDILQFKVEKEYYIKGISDAQRKEVINTMAQVLKDRLLSMNKEQMIEFIHVIKSSFDEKHILMYAKDPAIQSLFADQNWTGDVKQVPHDFLMVVDTNLAALKTDAVMQRYISYHVKKDESGKYLANVSITYDNQGTFTWKTTRYRTYTRVYVPLGSTFVRSHGAMDMDRSNKAGEIEIIEEEHGMTRFGAFIAIEPGKVGTLSFEYYLPEAMARQIEQNSYELLVQKQAGTQGHPLTLDLNFGKNIRSAYPAEDSRHWGDSTYTIQTDLREDRYFRVEF